MFVYNLTPCSQWIITFVTCISRFITTYTVFTLYTTPSLPFQLISFHPPTFYLSLTIAIIFSTILLTLQNAVARCVFQLPGQYTTVVMFKNYYLCFDGRRSTNSIKRLIKQFHWLPFNHLPFQIQIILNHSQCHPSQLSQLPSSSPFPFTH